MTLLNSQFITKDGHLAIFISNAYIQLSIIVVLSVIVVLSIGTLLCRSIGKDIGMKIAKQRSGIKELSNHVTNPIRKENLNIMNSYATFY